MHSKNLPERESCSVGLPNRSVNSNPQKTDHFASDKHSALNTPCHGLARMAENSLGGTKRLRLFSFRAMMRGCVPTHSHSASLTKLGRRLQLAIGGGRFSLRPDKAIV
jgi:hypothetical protein